MNNHQNGKGDKPRPVNKKVYNSNFDDINWSNKPKKLKFRTIDDVCGVPKGSFQNTLKQNHQDLIAEMQRCKNRIKNSKKKLTFFSSVIQSWHER